jgi:hypothetical protein
MANYAGVGISGILSEISKPGVISNQLQRAVLNNNAFYYLAAGKTEYKGQQQAKRVPNIVEETDTGTGYFESFILLKENGNITWRSREEGVATDAIDLGDRSKIEIRSLVGTIPLYQYDIDLNNANNERIVKLLTGAIEQAKMTATNLMGAGLFSAGTEYANKTIDGLEYWLPDTVTSGSVAGIDQATNANWRSYSRDCSAVSFATNAEAYIRTMITGTAFGGNFTDLILMDATNFARLQALINDQQRYIKENILLKAGFIALEFDGRSVVYDSGCPLGNIYGITSKLVRIAAVKGCNFVIGKWIEPVNEQYQAAKLKFRGNIVFLDRKPQGKLYTFDTA